MRPKTLATIVLFLAAAAPFSAQQYSGPVAPPNTEAENSRAQENYSSPIIFEANQGQTDRQVKFISHGTGYKAFLTAGAIILSLHPDRGGEVQARSAATSSNPPISTTLQLKLVGAAQNPAIVGEDPLPGRVNYFIGRDPSQWHTNIPTYSRVRYKNVYPGIDLVYYGSHQQLEYDFAISAGADVGKIQVEITGATQTELDVEGNLVLQTPSGEVRFRSPNIYQESNGKRTSISGSYVINDSTHIGFQVARHNQSEPLVIDPVLVYSTYLGGGGDDQPSGIAVDSTGNLYITGFTDSTDFPLATIGSLPAGNTHVFVAKLDASGSNLVYADYIGGNSQDYGYALVLDKYNNVYVTGSTASSDFPTVNAYQATYPGSFNGFLSKISGDGSSLLYSTYFGGNGSDLPASMGIDSLGSVLIAGNTSSTNFPVANAYQATAQPNQGGFFGIYGFLTKFSPDGSYLAYSTYFAGNTNVAGNCGGTPCWTSPFSAINSIAVDANGDAYAAGVTNTYNFPTTQSAYLATDSTHQTNPTVGFVSKFSSSGVLDYSTYFYESSALLTEVDAIAVDASGSAYATGVALSDGTFPVTSTTICDPAVSQSACGFAFVTKFDPAGSTLAYSTFLGPNNNATPRAIMLDSNNDAYVLSSTLSSSFGLVNGIEPYSNGSDLLLVEIDPLASTQLFATYLGASADEFAAGIALDSNGNIYIAGSTDSTDLPTTQGSFQNVQGGRTDVFVLKIGPSSAPSVSLSPSSLQYGAQSVGATSPAQTVLLRNMGSSPLAISSIAANGDFAESDTCGTTVPAAGSCSFSVTFTPIAAGTRDGSIVIQDNAAGAPHVINLSGVGEGPLASVAPQSLTFPIQSLGTTSAAQALTLTNGNQTLEITSIQVTGDFAQVNNCSSTLAATSSCIINVTFTPTALGMRTGTLTVSDNAQGGPQTASLTGSGPATSSAVAAVVPANLAFSAQPMKTFSTAQAVTLSNTGNATLNLGAIQVTGDFAQVNNCPSTLAATSSCTINVTFTPTASGTRTGNLTVSDNAQGSPQVVNITGAGADFSLSGSPSSDTAQPGSAATYKLTVSSIGGSFVNAVQLSCSGLPAQTSCALSPAAVNPGANAVTSTLSISTTATVAEAVPGSSRKSPIYGVWIRSQVIGLFGILLIASKGRNRKSRLRVLAAYLTMTLILMTGCAGGTGIAPTSQTPPQTGTAPGTYTVTVSGTSGNLQHSLPLTLVVQ
ncbi:MAG: choice-of-anchor D domain-containing protein [Candidatus Sulfotelmatobacter sp.]